MFKNNKRAFWEAFFLTAVVFVLGVLLGVAFENQRVEGIEDYYIQSEIASLDLFVLNNMVDLEGSSCEHLVQANLEFADKIYFEARLLEKYEDAGRITEKIRLAHRKYDLLRTFLWSNAEKTIQRCGEGFDLVIYLYEYDPEDLTQKAQQNVWSKILSELKSSKGGDILLIPIAMNSDLVSLDSKLDSFGISDFPVVVINNQHIISEISSVEDLESYLN